jgi:hypothetical protein
VVVVVEGWQACYRAQSALPGLALSDNRPSLTFPSSPPPPCRPPARRLADNTYAGTFGASGWGARASEVLVKVRGKDFRHEKTKKKRGTYRGGAIDAHTINSIKLDDD